MNQPWLRDLEEKVQEAAGRLRELKEENAELREENRQLTERSTELEASCRLVAGEAWQEERDEIRRAGRQAGREPEPAARSRLAGTQPGLVGSVRAQEGGGIS